MAEDKKCLVQEMHISCLAQLVAFEPGRAAMLEDSNVLEAVQVVAESGLSSVARELGQSVLLAMSDRHAEPAVPNSPRRAHIMLSYQWDNQAGVQRIVRELQARGYRTWFGARTCCVLALFR